MARDGGRTLGAWWVEHAFDVRCERLLEAGSRLWSWDSVEGQISAVRDHGEWC